MDAIKKVLDLSSLHVTPREMDLMNDRLCVIRCVEHRYGAVVFLPDEVSEGSLDDWRDVPNLLAAVRLALKHGCAMINFDCDAQVIAELPTFEWSLAQRTS